MEFKATTANITGLSAVKSNTAQTKVFNNTFQDYEEIDYNVTEQKALEAVVDTSPSDNLASTPTETPVPQPVETPEQSKDKEKFKWGSKLWSNALFYGINDVASGSLGKSLVASLVVAPLIALVSKDASYVFGSSFEGKIKTDTNGLLKSATQGFIKKFSSNVIKKRTEIIETLKKVLTSREAEALHDKANPEEVIKTAIGEATKFASDLAATVGIDYAASLFTNGVVNCLFSDKNLVESFSPKNLKMGSTFLKSSWKVTTAKAFEVIGISLGTLVGHKKAGARIGKVVGTTIGAVVGEFATNLLDNDEKWCAAAGVATVAGATAGGAIATAAIISASVSLVPGGFIVGAAIMVGAAAGTGIVWLLKKLTSGGSSSTVEQREARWANIG